MNSTSGHILDWASGAAVLGTLIGWLPPMAAFLGCVWYSILIYDRIQKARGVNAVDNVKPK